MSDELKPLSQDDREFLSGLQRELLTQDRDGQAAPRFWVVRDKGWETCWEANAERTMLCCCDGEASVDDALEYIELDPDEYESDEGKVDAIIEQGNGEYCQVPVRLETRIVPNTMFLTKREAQEYIQCQRHNPRMEPHTYAMGTYYSPQVKRLLELLETTDWNTRYERTCRITDEEPIEIPDQDPWYGMLDTGITRYKLSCGHATLSGESNGPKRCCECGAKVVEQ